MKSNSEKQSPFDPFKQLELLTLKCENLKPDLYKVNAFYLKLFRSILPEAVKEAIFQIVLSSRTNSNILSLDNKKESFQKRVDEIISEYISLLTIENLVIFSRELENDRIKKTSEDTFLNQNLEQKIDDEMGNNKPIISQSIELSLLLPTQNNIDLSNWNSQNQDISSCTFTSGLDQGFDERSNLDLNQVDFEEIAEEPSEINSEQNDLDVLKSLFMMAGDLMSPIRNPSKGNIKETPNLKDEKQKDTLLPESPEELYRWSFSIESALVRRMRNLSHLINLELIRIGLINSFIPPTLLDAAISGQLNAVKAPSNILRIKLPINPASNSEIDLSCLLIRTSELEFDNIKLRQCRQKMTEQRNILLKMVKQQNYWQSRSLAKEVREQWWKNTQTNQNKEI